MKGRPIEKSVLTVRINRERERGVESGDKETQSHHRVSFDDSRFRGETWRDDGE